AERSRNNERNVGLHVLGGGVPSYAPRLYSSSGLLRRRGRSRCDDLQHTDTATTPELRLGSELLTHYRAVASGAAPIFGPPPLTSGPICLISWSNRPCTKSLISLSNLCASVSLWLFLRTIH